MIYNSLEEIKLALVHKDLERKIAKEEIKNEYLHLTNDWKSILFSKPIVIKVVQFGIKYVIKRMIR